MSEPGKGFYVNVTGAHPDNGKDFVRLLVGPFLYWSEANDWLPKAEAHCRADQSVSIADEFDICLYQARRLPRGMLNAKLWVDAAKLVPYSNDGTPPHERKAIT